MEPQTPRDDVGHEVGQVDASRQVAMDKEGLGNNPLPPRPTLSRLQEVPLHLTNQKVALRAFKLVENHDPLRRATPFKEQFVEPLKQERVVPTKVIVRRPRRVLRDDAGESFTVEASRQLKSFADVCELGLPECCLVARRRGHSTFKAALCEFAAVVVRERPPTGSVTKDLWLEQIPCFQLACVSRVPATEAVEFCLVERLDKRPEVLVLDCNACENLIRRFLLILAGLIDKHEVGHFRASWAMSSEAPGTMRVPATHTLRRLERLNEAPRGASCLFIRATHCESPLGHGRISPAKTTNSLRQNLLPFLRQTLLAWPSPELKEPSLPELQDVYVVSERRREGIATVLTEAAEHEAKAKGFAQLMLSFGTDNEAARLLYERAGYRDAGLDPVRVTGTILIRGEQIEVDDTLVYLVKALD